MESKKQHILLTALGTSAKESSYSLRNKKKKALLSPIALVEMLNDDERPEYIIALCTKEAKDSTFKILEENVNIPCKAAIIPEGKDRDELSKIIECILQLIPDNAEITLELTHGLRHFPFLFFAAGLYLSALKNVKIRSAWYGMNEVKLNGCSPLVDLSILFELVDLFQAVKTFRNDGNAAPIVRMMEKVSNDSPRATSREDKVLRDFEQFVEYANGFAFNYGAGLPIELGESASGLNRKGNEIINEGNFARIQIPLVSELINRIIEAAEPFKFQDTTKFYNNWKNNIALDKDELSRQKRLIDQYLKNRLYNNAMGLIREFVVSRVCYTLKYKNINAAWLSYNDGDNVIGRKTVESKLNSLVINLKHIKNVSDNQKGLAELWDRIRTIRNELHHHGMKDSIVKVDDAQIGSIKQLWEKINGKFGDNEFWDPSFGGGGGRLLISALGLSPGLLYSAIVAVKPPVDKCIVITSKDAATRLDEVIAKAGYNGPIEKYLLKDPHAGFSEIEALVNGMREHLVAADEIICNATGGTTAIQHTIMRIGRAAEMLGKTVTWIALVDRRPSDEQRREPYVVGELVELRMEEER